MRFADNTVNCGDCGREISDSHDCGNEDEPFCSGCAARRAQAHAKTPCEVCKKPLGDAPFHYNTDCYERLIHSDCLNETKDPNEWSDDVD